MIASGSFSEYSLQNFIAVCFMVGVTSIMVHSCKNDSIFFCSDSVRDLKDSSSSSVIKEI